MSKHTHAASQALDALADDARALMSATADVAGDKVKEARARVAAALEHSKDVYGEVRDKAVEKALEGSRAIDKTVREYPYQAIAISAGVGLLVGLLAASRCACKKG